MEACRWFFMISTSQHLSMDGGLANLVRFCTQKMVDVHGKAKIWGICLSVTLIYMVSTLSMQTWAGLSATQGRLSKPMTVGRRGSFSKRSLTSYGQFSPSPPKSRGSLGMTVPFMRRKMEGKRGSDRSHRRLKSLNGVYFVTENEGWAVGEKGMLLNTKDGGVTWLVQQTPTSNGLIDITRSPDGVLWVVGEWGTVLKY